MVDLIEVSWIQEGRQRTGEEAEEEPGMQRKQQEPDTAVWGEKRKKPGMAQENNGLVLLLQLAVLQQYIPAGWD